jgi:hypothetical protein
MKAIKIKFVGFWPGFVAERHPLYRILARHYRVELVDPPDYVFFSTFGRGFYEFAHYDGVRIFYSGENYSPDFNVADYAIGFDHIAYEDRYLRYPLYLFYDQIGEAATKHVGIGPEVLAEKTVFCNFIYGNSHAQGERPAFFHRLSGYRPVSSAGTFLNNQDGFVADSQEKKLAFQRKCKFTIAFESTSLNGFVTEKIMHAFAARTVPIYFGDPLIDREMNPKAFVNCRDFPSFDAVVDRVREIDRDDALFLRMLAEPMFREPDHPAAMERRLERFLLGIFEQPLEKAFRRPRKFLPRQHEENLRLFAELQCSRSFSWFLRIWRKVRSRGRR